jgi:arabinose-5-phosphate isomerase
MRSADPQPVSDKSVEHAGDLVAAQRVLDYAGEAIAALGQSLNGDFSRAVDVLFRTRGRVIVSGMGKSGHIARKIAATLASTGTPAQFVHPAEASHGDLGAVTRADAIVLLSNTGETDELSHLIAFAGRFSIPLVGIASRADSTLLRAANIALLLPKVREACPMGLAPTTSTTLMLALGDALAVALMERRGFTPDQYRELHPGGSLGKALLRVRDLMHVGEEMPLVAIGARVSEGLIAMTSRRFGCVGVVDEMGGLVGIFTDGDLRRRMAPDLLERSIGEVMTREPKVTAPDQLAVQALAVMNEKKITVLFAIDPEDLLRKPRGVLHLHDCLQAGLQ